MDTNTFINSKLLGRFWHVTNLQRFKQIMLDGFIRPEPNLPDLERYSTNMGPRWYPFVRHIGGFSLFDLPVDFDLDFYRSRCPSSSLEALIPYREEFGHGVWLEIDNERQKQALLTGATVWSRCEREGQGRRCMPYIEAAHIGEMPTTSILSAHLFSKGDVDWQQIDLV